jgi:hypothetical protein
MVRYFFSVDYVLILRKNVLGYILGDFFHKPIWSPWRRFFMECRIVSHNYLNACACARTRKNCSANFFSVFLCFVFEGFLPVFTSISRGNYKCNVCKIKLCPI